MLSGRARALRVAVGTVAGPRARISELGFRVWPTDIDLNLHLTNARFPQIMDVGRLDLLARAGVLWPLLRSGARPVLVELRLVFRKELRLGARFALRSEAVDRDRKAIVIAQTFLRDGAVCAEGYAHIVALRGGRAAEPGLLATLLPDGPTSPR